VFEAGRVVKIFGRFYNARFCEGCFLPRFDNRCYVEDEKQWSQGVTLFDPDGVLEGLGDICNVEVDFNIFV
jgi:hypothetical protein